VPRLGERPVDAGAGDLEDVAAAEQVRLLDLGGVEDVGDLPGDGRDVVQGDAAVLVDDHAYDGSTTCRRDGHVLEVVATGLDRRREQLDESGAGR